MNENKTFPSATEENLRVDGYDVSNRPMSSDGRKVASVVFERFDREAGVAVEVVVHWTFAITYLAKTQAKVSKVLWADSVEGIHGAWQNTNRWGSEGWSYAGWEGRGEDLFIHVAAGSERGQNVVVGRKVIPS